LLCLYLPRGLNPVETRQINIHHNHVNGLISKHLEAIFCILRDANDRDAGFCDARRRLMPSNTAG